MNEKEIKNVVDETSLKHVEQFMPLVIMTGGKKEDIAQASYQLGMYKMLDF